MTAAETAGAGPQLDPEHPWPGLDAFDEGGRDYFHGREAEADELIRRVSEAPVTVLFGKSGLGKTSLLKAGLFPRLRTGHYLPIYIRLEVRPDAPPFMDQAWAAVRAAIDREQVDAPPPRQGETLWAYLHRSPLDWWDRRNYPLTPVLVFDQFEELFTLGGAVAAAVQRFRLEFGDLAENRVPASLADAAAGDAAADSTLDLRAMRYKVVVSLREDFLPDLEAWRRAIPSLGRVRVRLLPMRHDQAMAAVYQTAPHLMDRAIATRIVQFVAAEGSGASAPGADQQQVPPGPVQRETPDETATGEESTRGIEPALLSLFCRGLNERRLERRKTRFDDQLLDAAKQGIISDYYRSCVAGLPDSVSQFIENELITERGFRNSHAREDAVPAHLSDGQLQHLIARRLVRIEERYGTQRIELTHDLLTRAVRAHRDWRRAEQEREVAARRAEERQQALAEEARLREARLEEERRLERERRLQAEARAGRRFKRLTVALALALLGAVGMAALAGRQTQVARQQEQLASDEASRAREAATRARAERQRAERFLESLTDGIRMKQAVLSGDRTQIGRYLASDAARHGIRFTARAEDLGYRNPSGQQVFRFLLYPVRESLPSGDSAVALITYRMDHPTFQNALLTTGPQRGFSASYSGWGCLERVTVLIEYVDPQRPPQIAEYDMCAALAR